MLRSEVMASFAYRKLTTPLSYRALAATHGPFLRPYMHSSCFKASGTLKAT